MQCHIPIYRRVKTLTQHWLAVVLLLTFGVVHSQTMPDNMDSVGCTITAESMTWGVMNAGCRTLPMLYVIRCKAVGHVRFIRTGTIVVL